MTETWAEKARRVAGELEWLYPGVTIAKDFADGMRVDAHKWESEHPEMAKKCARCHGLKCDKGAPFDPPDILPACPRCDGTGREP